MSKKQIKKKGGSVSKQVKKKVLTKAKSPAKKVLKTAKKAKPAPKSKKAVKKALKPLSKAKATLKKPLKKVAKKIEKKATKVLAKVKTAQAKPTKAAEKKISKVKHSPVAKAKENIHPVSDTIKKINTQVNKVPEPIVEKTQANYLNKPLFNTGQINQQKINEGDMKDEKLRYSDDELKEFEHLISEKLEIAKKELNYIKEALSKKNDTGTDTTGGTLKLLEDGADTAEKESFTQLAARQQKFIQQLENAMARIKNGTYGLCVETGKLIPKERLRAVPHTQHSIEAKLNRKD